MEKFLSYIGGEFLSGRGYVDDVNPSNLTDIVGRAENLGVTAVDHAVAAAVTALPGWQASSQARATALDAIGTQILARKEELGMMLTREEGKPLAEGIGEVVKAGHIFKFFAGEALRIRGDNLESVRPGVKVRTRRRALGII